MKKEKTSRLLQEKHFKEKNMKNLLNWKKKKTESCKEQRRFRTFHPFLHILEAQKGDGDAQERRRT